MNRFSIYPAACPCDTGNLTKLNAVAATLPSKRIIIAETSYPYSNNAGLKPGQFPYSQPGQLQYVQNVIATVRDNVTNGYGVAWWGTEIVRGYGLGLTALWDEQGVGTDALHSGWAA
jgi:arabinogalactan endo-1,4-beta-galactosidase